MPNSVLNKPFAIRTRIVPRILRRLFLVILSVAAALGVAPVGRAQTTVPSGSSLRPYYDVSTLFGGVFGPDPGIAPRFTVRVEGGDGVGFNNGFARVESFTPLVQSSGRSLVFADLRGTNFFNDQSWLLNAGGGFRYDAQRFGVVVGVNAFFDAQNTDVSTFQQVGIGAEILGRVWETRFNAYIPVGESSDVRTEPGRDTGNGDTGLRFIGTHIGYGQIQVAQVAYGGFDWEVGRKLITRPGLDLRGYAGLYHYTAEQVESITGARVRAEARLNDNVSLYFSLQNDAVYDTTASAAIAFHFGPRGACRCPVPNSSLAERVVRNPAIVVAQSAAESGAQLMIDPATLRPIEVRHVSSSALPGGDGTVERPYQTLGQLQTGSGPQMILFAHANSVFSGQNIVLQNNQRFLGEGIPHYFTAVQGTYLLPRATNGINLPQIVNSPGNAITLANNNEVSGFVILNPQSAAIFGQNSANPFINRNTIGGAGGNGIYLIDPVNTALIDRNTVNGAALDGIHIDYTTAASPIVNITRNTVTNPTGGGIGIDSQNNSSATTNVTENAISNIAGAAVAVQNQGTSNATTTVGQNTISDAGLGIAVTGRNSAGGTTNLTANNVSNIRGDGIAVAGRDSSQGTTTLSGNTVANVAGAGVSLTFQELAAGNVTATQNAVSNAKTGVVVVHRDASAGTANVTNNAINAIAGNGVSIDGRDKSTGVTNVAGNSITNTSSNGVSLNFQELYTGSATVTQNTLTNIKGDGVLVLHRNDSAGTATVSNNTITGAGGSGVAVQGRDQSTGTTNVVANTVSNVTGNGVTLTFQENSANIINVSQNSVTGAASGIVLESRDNAVLMSPTINQNSVRNVASDGIVVSALGDSQMIFPSLTGNTISNVGGSGMKFTAAGNGVVVDASVANNQINGSGGTGIKLDMVDNGIFIGTFSNNSVTASGGSAFTATQTGNAFGSVYLLGNTFDGFGATGVTISLVDSTVGSYQIARNTFQGVGVDGLSITTNDNSVMVNQTIFNTTNQNFLFSNLSVNSTFLLENTLASNTYLGGAASSLFGPITLIPFGSGGFPPP